MSTVKCFIVAILSLLVFTANAIETRAEIKTASGTNAVKEGDLVDIDIHIWPLESADLTEFKKIEGSSLVGMFSVLQINSIGISANNADVVEIKALAAVSREKNQSRYSIDYRGTLIPLSALSLKIEEPLSIPKEFFVMDQSFIVSKYFKIVLSACLFILVIAGILKRRKIQSWIAQLKADPIREQKQYYQLLFSKASARSDFESIYSQKAKWQPLLISSGLGLEEFYKVMEKHQYKKEWKDNELSEVSTHFEAIRGSFNER